MKSPKKIKACFETGKTFKKDGLYCKALVNAEKSESDKNQGIEILVGASSRIKVKAKRNRIKRIIRAHLLEFFQNETELYHGLFVIIGNEKFNNQDFQQRQKTVNEFFHSLGPVRA